RHGAAGEVWEFPLATARVRPWRAPLSGGGYFRLYPFGLTRRWLASLNRAGRPFGFYVHPWEIDPEQPRIYGASRLSRFRHYANLASTERKLDRLLSSFRFGTIGDVIAEHQASAAGAGLPPVSPAVAAVNG